MGKQITRGQVEAAVALLSADMSSDVMQAVDPVSRQKANLLVEKARKQDPRLVEHVVAESRENKERLG